MISDLDDFILISIKVLMLHGVWSKKKLHEILQKVIQALTNCANNNVSFGF